MKTLYLHIGQPKTGTTSIQRFCHENTEKLREHGLVYQMIPWIYPGASRRRNANVFTRAVRDEEGVVRKELKMERVEQALDMIRGWLREADKVLLTDEAFWNYFGRKGYRYLKKLNELAGEEGACLKVIVYLRRQDDWLMSIYRQRVKGGEITSDWKSFDMTTTNISTHYEKELRRIERIIGRENLLVRRYDRAEFYEGSLEKDFLLALGLEPDADYTISEDISNPTSSLNHIEIRRLFSKLDEQEVKYSDMSLWLQKYMNIMTSISKSKKQSLMSLEERKEFMKEYEKENARIAKRYFGDGRPLFRPVDEEKSIEVWKPENPERYEDTVLFFASICLDQQKQLDALASKLLDQQRQMNAWKAAQSKKITLKTLYRKIFS